MRIFNNIVYKFWLRIWLKSNSKLFSYMKLYLPGGAGGDVYAAHLVTSEERIRRDMESLYRVNLLEV